MSYQWKVGELAVCIDASKSDGVLHEGWLYPISEVAETYKNCNPGIQNSGTGLLFETGPRPTRADYWSSRRFHPLHGTDIRKLEEKYPEYVIKTNEVEG